MTDPRLAWLVAQLAARVAVDQREVAARRRFDAELSRLVRPFDRTADPVHVTASAVIVGPRGVLLHRHKRLNLWLQPGGHVDGSEWPHEAAFRETIEETGIVPAPPPDAQTPVGHVDVHGGGQGHVHLDVRYVMFSNADPAPAAGESLEVRWFGWPEALATADAGLSGLLRTLRPST